jgi:pentatricopeptide repeat protein
MDADRISKLLALARDLANQRTDAGLDKAAGVLLQAIDEGYQDPQVLVNAATYLLQGPRVSRYEVKKKALYLIDRAVAQETDNIPLLEKAISGYELILNDFPDRLNAIVRISLKILDLDPNHIDSMITLASHRENPGVSLSLEEATRMLEWAREVEPNNIFAAYALARLYAEARQYKKARDIYRQIMENGGRGAEEAVNAEHKVRSKTKDKNKRMRKYGVN